VKGFVLVILAAVCLAACGASSSMSGSMVKRETVVAAPNAVEVADAAKRSTDATTVSHPVEPVNRPADRSPVTRVSRPATALPSPDPDRVTSGLSCQGFGVPGRIQVMCLPQ
jgi:ABC-type oligopeptide transport system substrate-binding subunit